MSQPTIKLEDKSEIDDKVDSLVAKLLASRQVPSVVHHYTTTSGLLGIVSSGKLRATNIEFLNDTKELQHAIDLFHDEAKKLAAMTAAGYEQAWLTHVAEKLAENRYGLRPVTFVTCFSSEADELGQWRAYGKGDGGVSIGFLSEKLIQRIGKYGGILVPAVYSEAEQRAFCAELLAWGASICPVRCARQDLAESKEYVSIWNNYLSQRLEIVATMFKHPSFSSESEWRIVYPDQKLSDFSYVAKNNHLSMCIDFDLSAAEDLDEKHRAWMSEVGLQGDVRLIDGTMGFRTLPAVALWSGPGAMKWETYRAAENLLWSRGYFNVNFGATRSPFRAV